MKVLKIVCIPKSVIPDLYEQLMDIINITSDHQTTLPTGTTTLKVGMAKLIISPSLNPSLS